MNIKYRISNIKCRSWKNPANPVIPFGFAQSLPWACRTGQALSHLKSREIPSIRHQMLRLRSAWQQRFFISLRPWRSRRWNSLVFVKILERNTQVVKSKNNIFSIFHYPFNLHCLHTKSRRHFCRFLHESCRFFLLWRGWFSAEAETRRLKIKM